VCIIGLAYKNCTENGTWFFNTTTKKEYANYDECRMTPEKEKVFNMYYLFSLLSSHFTLMWKIFA
jgi:hypothetical protein